MFRYEILMLAVPEITQDESKELERRLHKVIERFKASVISFERWGKFRLAYPVKKNSYGVYFLMRFESEGAPIDLLKELSMIFAVKLNDIVMRHMVSRLEADASLAYHRPQSLEDTPTRDVDSFIRENKMEGLLSLDKKGESQEKRALEFSEEETAEASA